MNSIGWYAVLVPDSVLFDMVTNGKVESVILGCDACDGEHFVNKSGSGALAALAHDSGTPCEIWTTTHKVLPRDSMKRLDFSHSNFSEEDEGNGNNNRREKPLFGIGKLEHITRVRTERGVLSPDQLLDFVKELPVPPNQLFRRPSK